MVININKAYSRVNKYHNKHLYCKIIKTLALKELVDRCLRMLLISSSVFVLFSLYKAIFGALLRYIYIFILIIVQLTIVFLITRASI